MYVGIKRDFIGKIHLKFFQRTEIRHFWRKIGLGLKGIGIIRSITGLVGSRFRPLIPSGYYSRFLGLLLVRKKAWLLHNFSGTVKAPNLIGP